MREHVVDVPAGGEARVTGRLRVGRPRLVRYPAEHQFRVSALGADAAGVGHVRHRG